MPRNPPSIITEVDGRRVPSVAGRLNEKIRRRVVGTIRERLTMRRGVIYSAAFTLAWVMAMATHGFAQKNGRSLSSEQLLSQFVNDFHSTKSRSLSDSGKFGQQFAWDNSSVSIGPQLIALAASSSDARLRNAALSAAVELAQCGPAAKPLVRWTLFDSESRNRLLALRLVGLCSLDDTSLLAPVADLAMHDRSQDVVVAAADNLADMLAALGAGRDEGAAKSLEQLKLDLDLQLSLRRDANQEARLKARSGDISNSIAQIRANVQASLPSPILEKSPAPYDVTAVRSWLSHLNKRAFAALLIVLILVVIHLYYLALLAFSPRRLFALTYGRYPAFIVPYILRPDLYKRLLRPAVGLLAALQDPKQSSRYSEYAKWLVIAARTSGGRNKVPITNELVRTLRRTDDGHIVHTLTEEATGAERNSIDLQSILFGVLTDIDENLAQKEMDLKPEDPEIRAARANMKKIMELPSDTWNRPGIELAHDLKQATTISADFYNVIARASDSYAVYMVDVDYHGLPASLEAMQVCFALKASRDWGMTHPTHELELADQLVRDMSGGSISVTMNFLEIDLANKCVRYASAGMPPALLFTKGHEEPTRLNAVGDYIGAGYTFLIPAQREAQATIGRGDLIVLCSDGILEARRGADPHPYGEPRLIAAVKTHRDKPAKEIVEAIVQSCKEYSGRAKPSDDQSVIVIRIKGDDAEPSDAPAPSEQSLNVSVDNELLVKATLRRVADWPGLANRFVKDFAMKLAGEHLNKEACGRFRSALQEAISNAIRHGTDEDQFVTLEVSQLPEGQVEAVVTQQHDWIGWESCLGDRRRRELSETIAKTKLDQSVDLPLGGATLITMHSDQIFCTGRRLILRFKNRPVN